MPLLSGTFLHFRMYLLRYNTEGHPTHDCKTARLSLTDLHSHRLNAAGESFSQRPDNAQSVYQSLPHRLSPSLASRRNLTRHVADRFSVRTIQQNSRTSQRTAALQVDRPLIRPEFCDRECEFSPA